MYMRLINGGRLESLPCTTAVCTGTRISVGDGITPSYVNWSLTSSFTRFMLIYCQRG